jgi:type II secretory pathway pseudopilin PulG
VSHNPNENECFILDFVTPDDFEFDNDSESGKRKKKKKSAKHHSKRHAVRIICIVLSLLIILGSAVGVFVYNRNNSQDVDTRDIYTTLTQTFKSHGEDYPAAFEELKKYNNKIEAWITLENSSLDFPVLFTDSDDDSYFDHLPDGSENIIGSVYSSGNIIVKDPRGISYNKKYSAENLANTTGSMWGFGKNPFGGKGRRLRGGRDGEESSGSSSTDILTSLTNFFSEAGNRALTGMMTGNWNSDYSGYFNGTTTSDSSTPTTSSTVSNVTLSGSTNADKIWNYYKSISYME